MLTLSAVITAGGVLADSTATVIGAMVIAPLSTPIMGVALGLVTRTRSGAGRFVLGGAATVVAVGLLASLALPRSYDLLSNTQISGRTSPGRSRPRWLTGDRGDDAGRHDRRRRDRGPALTSPLTAQVRAQRSAWIRSLRAVSRSRPGARRR